ncbi:hypothetical protein B0H11DRAFT_2274640 [Mycena galericulata]|nr:hypothetical protein B0H11DRAFT_2274640 [Mycena galericulata]
MPHDPSSTTIMPDSPQTPRPPRTRSQTRYEALAAADDSTPRPSRQPAPPAQAGNRRPQPFSARRPRTPPSPSDADAGGVPQNLRASMPSPDLAPVLPLDPAIVKAPPTLTSSPIPLIDFLRIPPPEISPIYEEGKLKSTRSIPQIKTLDIVMQEDERLLCVVPCGEMMLPLMNHVKMQYKDIEIVPQLLEHRDWILSVHPAVTSTFLPAVIHSESDTEDWVLNVLWRPALAAHWAAEHKDFSRMGKSPNLTSCSGGGPAASLPDAMLWDPAETKRVLKATIEVKTHAAFVDATFEKNRTFGHLLRVLNDLPPGYGVRFVWPESDTETGTDTADKMIVQVWIQMVKHQMRIAALTNYNSVIFFVREGQTLYVSGEHTRADDIFLAIFAFIAYALGSIPADTLTLPADQGEWWNQFRLAGTAEAPGLDRTYVSANFCSFRHHLCRFSKDTPGETLRVPRRAQTRGKVKWLRVDLTSFPL